MLLRAENLRKTYVLGGNVVKALDGVNLDIAEGEFVAITGASGSGKSTMMNILGCLDQPDEGSYWLAGEDVARLSEDRLAEVRNRRIGFVFQTFNLLPRTTALDNVALPLLYAAVKDSKERAMKALEMVGLADRSDHHPSQLSGGQRQRVAIARALVNNPAIILADEPTGNLDSRTSDEILKIFESLNAGGRTIIMVTHEPDVAQRCKRQIFMRDGKIRDLAERGW